MRMSEYFDLGFPHDPPEHEPETEAEFDAEFDVEETEADYEVDPADRPPPVSAGPARPRAATMEASTAASPARHLLLVALAVTAGAILLYLGWLLGAGGLATVVSEMEVEAVRRLSPSAATPVAVADLMVGIAALVLAIASVLLAAGAFHRWVPRVLGLEIGSWMLLAQGIFVRQNIAIPEMSWSASNLSWAGLLVSLIVAAAVFPWAMRVANRLRSRPGLEMLLVPFSLGFFLDLAAVAAATWVPTLMATS
jgi:hypothetical protein